MVDLTVISRVMEKQNLVGFVVVDSKGDSHLLDMNQIAMLGTRVNYLNAEYSIEYKTLNGTHGASLTDYPMIDKNYTRLSRNGLTVMYMVNDASTKKPVGVVAFNATGMRYNLTFGKLRQLGDQYKYTNFEFGQHKDFGLIPMMKDKTLFPTIEMVTRSDLINIAKISKGGNTVKQASNADVPMLSVTSFMEEGLEDYNKQAQDRLMEMMFNMQTLSPYYYACFSAIIRKPAPGLGTFAVTEDTMFYDIAFAAQLGTAELTFVMIHEIMHIAMCHSLRFGSRLNHKLWNVACDLYINSIICKDFGCYYGGGVKEIRVGDKRCVIKAPEYGVFIETIGEEIDTAVDTPETIYNKLLKENPSKPQGGSSIAKPGSDKSSSVQGQGSSSQQPNGGSSSQQSTEEAVQEVCDKANQQSQQLGNQAAQDANQKIQNAAKKLQESLDNGDKDQAQQNAHEMQQGVNEMGQSGNDANSQQNLQNAMDDVYNSLNDGSSSSGSGNSQGGSGGSGSSNQGENALDNLSDDGSGNGGFQQIQDINVTYNGKQLKGKIMVDVMTNRDSENQDNSQKNVEDSRKALQRIKTKIKMEREETGEDLAKNAGVGGDLMERYIDIGLSTGIRWDALLRNLLAKDHKKTFTLANPNQDYMSMGMTIAGRRAIGKPDRVARVKFCIDVSGSVSEKALQYYLSEINNIFRHYKVDGELIYWSTMIGDAGMFSSLKDMLKIKPNSTGGTDVRCVFDYLARVTKVDGKYEADRVKDIKGVFILTDGYFSNNYSEYADAFDKKTVWLVTSNPITFNPPFGRVIGIDEYVD